jgi:hypothetical protein
MKTHINLIQAFIAKDGRPLIPAYTVQNVWDEQTQFTYWIVNLHDFVISNGTKFNIKLFHDEPSARTFAAEQFGKPQ